ncbi:MAG: hypothetical protein ACE5JU_10175 [Candidatus Binatia bacterium]
MEGRPSYFESIVTRLGFQIEEESTDRVCLVWYGARFPGLLCLGVSLVLLFFSVPVLEAMLSRGLGGTAASLWYFPAMNISLFGVALFLLSLKRTIVTDQRSRRVFLSKRSLLKRRNLAVDFSEIVALRLGTDMVYSGPALAGSTMGQSFFPAFSLRLVLESEETVLLDRGRKRNIDDLANRLSRFLDKPITRGSLNPDPKLQTLANFSKGSREETRI